MINVKVCDMSPSCGGIDDCPTGAFYWDSEKNVLAHDAEKCIGCGKCANSCPVAQAIRFAKNAEEEKQIQAEFDADPRRAEDLFIDRYGGDICLTKTTESDDALAAAKSAKGLAILELNQDDKIRCLLMSIPMKELFGPRDGYTHIKVFDPTEELASELGVSEFPSLVFFRDGEIIGKIEGYYENVDGERGLLEKQIAKILGGAA